MTMIDGGLQVDRLQVDGVAVVIVRGGVDWTAAQLLRDTFDSLDPDEHLYVDCGGVGFVDAQGLAVLCEVAQRNVMAGGPLHVLASTALRRMIWITGVEHLFALD